MKKILITYIAFFVIIQNISAIEIRTNKIIGGYKKQSFSINGIKDFYYTINNEIVLKCDYFNTYRYFIIDEMNNIQEIDINEKTKYDKIKIAYDNKLKYNYNLQITDKLIAFEETVADSAFFNYIPEPLFFYITDKDNEIVFNFNEWKIDHKEFFPISTYNSLSEEIFYTDEDRERIMKLHASFTVKDLYLVNKKQNKIAIVLYNYNTTYLSALIIFDVLYNATINDFKVRLRKEPNLDCETLSYFYEGNKVKIVDQSDEPYEIDGENWYWYKVESGSYPVGWVYGKYLDIEK